MIMNRYNKVPHLSQDTKYTPRILSDVASILLINVKMPTVVGILTFMSSIKSMLSSVGHDKKFMTKGRDRN